MKWEIFWTEPARFDLRRLSAWVERHSPGKEKQEALRIQTAVNNLAELPRVGKRISVPDQGKEELRELFIAPYVIQYVVAEKAIWVIRLWHYRENRTQTFTL